MLGEPKTITLEKILTISEAIKLAETAKDLDFKTGFKLARLGDAISGPVKEFNKQKKVLLQKLNDSEQKQSDINAYQEAIENLLETIQETIAIPSFTLSEFVYTDKSNAEQLNKLKVTQKFLNLFFPFITDDLISKKKTSEVNKEKLKVVEEF